MHLHMKFTRCDSVSVFDHCPCPVVFCYLLVFLMTGKGKPWVKKGLLGVLAWRFVRTVNTINWVPYVPQSLYYGLLLTIDWLTNSGEVCFAALPTPICDTFEILSSIVYPFFRRGISPAYHVNNAS